MDAPHLDPQFAQVLVLMSRLADGAFESRGAVPTGDDNIDALLTGLNILGEELQHQSKCRVRAEGLLQDALDHYEHAPAYFCSVDVVGLDIVKCNQTLATALGLSKEAVLRRRFNELFVPGQEAELIAGLEQARTREPMATELQLSAADGATADVTLDVSLATSDGAPRYRVVMRDITARHQLEAQLRQSQKMEAVGQLAGGVAHDFNNLLTVIIGAGAMLRAHASDPDANTLVQEILDAADNASELTRRLLSFANHQTQRAELVQCGAVVDRTVSMLRRLITHIQLRVSMAPDLWNVKMGPGQLEQVLMNLTLNARDAMPDGGTIGIEARNVTDADQADWVQITVRDAGMGMQPEVLERVFEPFFTTKPRERGTGLGLTMCYGIVDQANGRIFLQSVVGQGTSVHVHLPRFSGAYRLSVQTDAVTECAGRILLVEDEQAVRKGTTRLLGRMGYEVLEVSNGTDALALLQSTEQPIDLILTDVVMPGMSGMELVDRARQHHPDIPVLYMSGYAPDLPADSTDSDTCDFLAKPFKTKQLVSCIQRLLTTAARRVSPSQR